MLSVCFIFTSHMAIVPRVFCSMMGNTAWFVCGLHYPGLAARVKSLSITTVKQQQLLFIGDCMPAPRLRPLRCQFSCHPWQGVGCTTIISAHGHKFKSSRPECAHPVWSLFLPKACLYSRALCFPLMKSDADMSPVCLSLFSGLALSPGSLLFILGTCPMQLWFTDFRSGPLAMQGAVGQWPW